ncbi:MAG: 2-C-methyl-D-erythritol 4-phosphate cytidylyltransferase [Oscillospiraceae bacterium]|jgi:2-C-methyl-D-erythritol 4-phosphate cytidylyltransferase|nr:2-C-methyl-D-erythritol 4-phosphate cytidylyltransferase [Oscillospiraceae bacterium]
MIIAAIFAGGNGSRMGNSNLPKQFLMLGTKPILVHTVEKFLIHPRVERVIVLCPRAWMSYTEDLLVGTGVPVLEGGETRNGTLQNALDYTAAAFGTQEDHILITHDAVRPFVTQRIIGENINAALEHGACDTVIPATDTIVQSEDGVYIFTIPERRTCYQGQTPQTFRTNKLRKLIESLTDTESEILTDACKIFSMRGEPVAMVQGEIHNIKITYPYDMKVAQALLGIHLEEAEAQ